MFRLICLFVYLHLLNNPIVSHPHISVRHLRLVTNHRQYLIECPYNFNRLSLKFFNYSNEFCSQLYSSSSQRNLHHIYSSPYLFQAKPILLHCHRSIYSTHVEITYQCSFSASRSTFSNSSSPSIPLDRLLLLLGFVVLVLLILLWCLWYISIPSTKTSTCPTSRQCCLHVNPMDTRPMISPIHRR